MEGAREVELGRRDEWDLAQEEGRPLKEAGTLHL